jgi:FkbM family methyltransferase
MCADEESAAAALTILKNMYGVKANFNEIYSVYTEEMYRIPGKFELNIAEHIADCGSFNGDTIKYLGRHISDYRKIYAIEMDGINFGQLLSNTKDYKNIEYYNVGICDHDGSAVYTSNAEVTNIYSSARQSVGSAVDNQASSVRLTTLDSLLSGKPVSFLKMDIEGAEPAALRGAEKIIREQKPKCAICVYHNPEHFFEVPFLLKQFVPEYKIYFRHHTQQLYETICYAIV